MAQYTEKLELRLIQPTDQFADESFNKVIRDADDKLVGVAHLTSGAHWETWSKETSYNVNDVVRWPKLHGHQYARCQESGVSGTTMPTNNVTGSVVTDNTVKWQIESLTDSSENGGRILIWTSGSYYARGDAVYYGKVLYRCKVVHQATTFSSDIGNWQEIYASIRPWVTNIYYAEDDVVLVGDDLFLCNIAHTSGSNFNNTEKANWSLLGSFGLIKEWQVSTHYYEGQMVTYNNIAYICTIEHESDEGQFKNDIAKWKLFDASVVPWGISDYYSLGSLVIYDNRIWKCILAHDRVTDIFEDTQTNWVPLGYNLPAYLKPWQPNTYYYLHQTVLIDNKYLYKCTRTHISEATWSDDESDWVKLGSIEGVVKEWQPNVRYYANQLVTYLGTLYRAVALHDSGSSFEGDVAEWRQINANLGFWATNTYYPISYLVEYNHMVYRCSEAHTSISQFDVSKWIPLLAFPVIEEWQVDTNYLENQVVKFNNMLLIAVDTHTSDSTDIINDLTTPNIHWNLVYANIQTWQANTKYKIGTQVIYNNNLYQAKDTHTSGSTFDIAHCELIGQFDAFVYDWQANKYYYANQVIIRDKELYRSDSNHTSGSTWDDDRVNWTKISSAVVIDDWASSTEYLLNEVVVWNGVLYRCNTAHTSSTTFDDTKFTPIYANVAPWQASTQYLVDQLVMYNNQLYKCITAHTSQSAFESDGAKWQPVANNIAGIPAWGSGIYYYQNQVVKYNGKIWRCLTAHISGTEEKPDYVKKYESNAEFLHYDDDWGIPLSDTPKDYTVDIGYSTKANKIRLEYGGGYIWVNTSIKVSNDGTNFTTLDTESFSNSGSYEVEFYADVRYIRITANSATNPTIGGGSLAFNYLGLWGDSPKWECILDLSSIALRYWTPSTHYKVDDIVLYNNEFYRCIETNDSGSAFDTTKWKKIPRMSIPDWKVNEDYAVNQVVFYEGKLYRCVVAHTSGTTFLQANWTPVNDIIEDWSTNTEYYVNQVVWYNNSLWRCKTSHKSSTETPNDNVVYTSTTNIAEVNDTSTIPYEEIIDLGEVKLVEEISYEIVATGMSAKYHLEISEDGMTYALYDECESITSTQYIKVVVDSVNIETGATNPDVYLDNFIVKAQSDKWQEISTMNNLIDEDIDSMFI